MMKRKLGKRVAPTCGDKIRKEAQQLRDALQQKKPYIKVVSLLEVLQEMEFLEFEIIEDQELGDEEAISYPDKGLMKIKQSVYDKAYEGDGHCRFTIAHELGHLQMHKGQASFARGETEVHEVYEDSEWQADTFASEFLIDQRLITKNDSIYDLSKRFGVSHSAAARRLTKLRNENQKDPSGSQA